MIRNEKPAPIRRDWTSKTLAGVLLGLALALGASGLLSHFTQDIPLTTRAQLVMWVVPPIWLGIAGCVYFFSSGLRAWAWLGGATLLVHGSLWLARLA